MFNYINFETASEEFKAGKENLVKVPRKSIRKSNVSILPDFTISSQIVIDGFIIHPTERIRLAGKAYAYVSFVEFPEWMDSHKAPNYIKCCSSIVLSALLSLASERCVQSFYEDPIFGQPYKDQAPTLVAGVHHPIQIHGPGAIDKPQESEDIIIHRFIELYKIIMALNDKDYVQFMRFCRLFQLAQSNKYVDNSMSLSLIVSAIESVASKVITIEDVVPNWKEVKKKCILVSEQVELPGEFTDLLSTKLEQHYLKRRIGKFVSNYAPFNSLEMKSRSYNLSQVPGVSSEMIIAQNEVDELIDPLNHFLHENRKNEEIQEDLRKVIEKTYQYRSKFFHMGKSGPDIYIGNDERYFKEIRIYKSSPIIIPKDFFQLNLNTNRLWNTLKKDGYITKDRRFTLENIEGIDNDYFDGNGRDIRQVFYKKSYKKEIVATFSLMAHIGRVAITQYYKELLSK